jgi:hypothetical protein
MTFGEGIYSFMSATLSTGNRIYPLTLPQGVTLPAVTYQVVSETPLNTHSTAQDSPTHVVEIQTTRVQFSFYGRRYSETEALANEFKASVLGYRGAWGNVDVQAAVLELALDDYEPETKLWRRIVDVAIKHNGGVND